MKRLFLAVALVMRFSLAWADDIVIENVTITISGSKVIIDSGDSGYSFIAIPIPDNNLDEFVLVAQKMSGNNQLDSRGALNFYAISRFGGELSNDTQYFERDIAVQQTLQNNNMDLTNTEATFPSRAIRQGGGILQRQ